MATQPPRQVASLTQDRQPQAPQHYVAPTARDLRAQSVHRLQVGLFGLAAMLLLVGLANIIMDRARLADAMEGLSAGQVSKPAQSDPLADIGVVPAASPTETSASPAPAGSPGN